jgi:GlpG protein
MLWLLALGSQIEKRSGSLRLGILVVLTAGVSNLCQYLFSEVKLDPDTWMPIVVRSSAAFGGMSGVVFGLFGYVWLRVLYQPDCGLTITHGTVFLMIAWLFLCMTGWVGPIANTAHLAGLTTGMVAGYVAARWQSFGRRGGNS